MVIIRPKLKYKILEILRNVPYSQSLSAREGANRIFASLKNEINEEIFFLYLESCIKEFFKEYIFEDKEPFIKGYMEARYFILRKFNIRFSDFFSSSNLTPPAIVEKTDKDIKYA